MIDGIISAAFTQEHKCTKADPGAGEMKDDVEGGEGESMSEVGEIHLAIHFSECDTANLGFQMNKRLLWPNRNKYSGQLNARNRDLDRF